MEKNDLKNILDKLITDFKTNNAWKNSEESIQSQYTLDLLSKIGWGKKNIIINQGQEVNTGKKPDVVLKDNNNYTIIVIESKEAKKKDKLDGKYQTKTFQEQLVGYCEAEGIYWGILTNFIEWRIYNTHQNILYNNKKYAFHDLLWEDANKKEYTDLLSDEGLDFLLKIEKSNLVNIRGRWDENTVFYPTQEEIKDDFFTKIKNWRSLIRSNINQNYKDVYSIHQIDLITQKLIDRLIFIDYCSDNFIISQDILHAILHTKKEIFNELKRVFLEMDEKFNSELFSHDSCDDITIKNEIIEPIISELTAIDFTRLSVHVIGEVYENYLGELLKQTKKRVKLEEKKGLEKKKKQGIYYTPENIVDYIVKNTVGKKLSKCKTESDIEKIKVLDPACGSGSFLIRVFDEFLLHYKRVNKEGLLFEFDIKKKILQNNLYGVDLDERAVEIAKLNLMIKALEKTSWQDLKGKKLLPNLKLNIRCGNSLISEEIFYDKSSFNSILSDYSNDFEKLISIKLDFHKQLDDDKKEDIFNEILILEEKINFNLNKNLGGIFKEPEKIKPFNYGIAFCEVFQNGGFDVVVGNPPYINVENLDENERMFYMSHYSTALKRFDIYIAFIERGVNLLKENGLISYIIPYPFLTQDYGQKLREFILNNCIIDTIYDLSKSKIFENATVSNIIFIFNKENSKNKRDKNKINVLNEKNTYEIKQIEFYETPENMYRIDAFSENTIDIIKKIQNNSTNLGKIAIASWGARGVPVKNFHLDSKINDFCKKMVKGSDIDRYSLSWSNKWLLYDLDELYRPAFVELFESEKIFISKVTGEKGLKGVYDDQQYYSDDSLNCIILKHNLLEKDNSFFGRRKIAIEFEDFELSKKYNLKFILGLINSKMINFYFNNFLGYNLNVYPESIEQIPIKIIETEKDIKLKNDIIELVDNILSLDSIKNNYHKFKALDYKIDEKVCELYGLSPEEIKIIEN